MKRTTEIIGQARLGAFLLTPPIKARLVDDFGTAKKYRTASQPKPRTRKPRTRKHVPTVQIVNERFTEPADVRLALAQQMARDFYTAEPEFKLNYALLSR